MLKEAIIAGYAKVFIINSIYKWILLHAENTNQFCIRISAKTYKRVASNYLNFLDKNPTSLMCSTVLSSEDLPLYLDSTITGHFNLKAVKLLNNIAPHRKSV